MNSKSGSTHEQSDRGEPIWPEQIDDHLRHTGASPPQPTSEPIHLSPDELRYRQDLEDRRLDSPDGEHY